MCSILRTELKVELPESSYPKPPRLVAIIVLNRELYGVLLAVRESTEEWACMIRYSFLVLFDAIADRNPVSPSEAS